MPIDLLNFVRKWNASTLTERSAAPQHFRDLCEVLEIPRPTQTDEIGANYTYEKRVAKAGSGEEGFADVWKRSPTSRAFGPCSRQHSASLRRTSS
jgi:hypothetical protein